MTRAELLALADRVETEEPSEELRRAVLVACGWVDRDDEYDNWSTPGGGVWPAPHPLRSLDAAASLMPPTVQEVTVRNYPTGTYVRATTKDGTPIYSEMLAKGGPCEAQARTAAALRAIAMEAKDE
jgi:hypothetical protein